MLCENEHFNFMHKGHNFQDWWLAFQKSLLPTVLQWRLLLDVAARNYCMHATNIPWNLNIVLQLSCEAVLKISSKNIENVGENRRKEYVVSVNSRTYIDLSESRVEVMKP